MIFGWAQILMDLEPLFVLLRGAGRLHGISHTYGGATVIGAAAALSGRYLSECGLRLLRPPTVAPLRVVWPVVWASAFVGTYTHVLLDSVMHGDMTPYYPFSELNPLLGAIGYDMLHRLCVYSGLAGTVLYVALALLPARPRRE